MHKTISRVTGCREPAVAPKPLCWLAALTALGLPYATTAATLQNGDHLTFFGESGGPTETQPATGSWFFVSNVFGSGEPPTPIGYVPLSAYNGLLLGSIQLASGSHMGLIDGSESPDIDQPWEWFGNTGMHQSVAPTSVIDANTIDFSGWQMTWNTVAIPLGGGSQDCGTSSDGLCVLQDGTDIAGIVDLGSGEASINVFGGDGSVENPFRFTLDYQAKVPYADPSGFGGIDYQLHLTNVPVPAAIWLFGSGLPGLISIARKKAT